MNEDTFTCSDCGATKPVNHTGGTGYGIYREDGAEKKVCYDCCGKRDKADMIETGKAVLYWNGKEVTNWSGTLRFFPNLFTKKKVAAFRSLIEREDVWFTGPDRKQWHGINKGDNQILRAKRLK
jgi:hypothetical protein